MKYAVVYYPNGSESKYVGSISDYQDGGVADPVLMTKAEAEELMADLTEYVKNEYIGKNDADNEQAHYAFEQGQWGFDIDEFDFDNEAAGQMKYVIRDREAGNEIERFATREEAEQQLAQYEEQDRADGIFVEDFYEIVERCNDNEKMKRISWDEYYKTKQDVYLDNENVADMSVKFDLCNENGERVRASVLKAYSDESFFGGGNDEYIVIDFNGNSFLLYDCTLEEVESSYRELGFK